MSEPHRHDLEPDQAALDELMRAFADEPAGPTDVDELVIVEQDPLPDPTPADPKPVDGSVIVEQDPTPADPKPVDVPVIVEQDPTPADPKPVDGPVIVEQDPTPADPKPVDVPDDAEPTGPPSPPSGGTVVIDDDVSDGVEGDRGGGPTVVIDDDVSDGVEGDRGGGPTIVISVDDDLPDPVYVDGSLDRDGSRTIVVIEDDQSGDTVLATSERDARRGIEPRMRERRVAVRRAQGRKRLKRFGVVAAVVIVVVGVLAVLGSPWFAIQADQLVVTGNVYTDAERLQEVVDDLVGTPVLLADTQGAERDLEAIPWVETARVRTDFPHGASIEIRERQAITTYQGPDGRFRVLDREGRVLDVIDQYPFAYLLLGGPDPVDLDPGEFAPRGYAAASELAKILTGTVRGRVEIIEVTADGSRLVMRLDDGTEVRFGEARELLVKLVRLETVLSSSEQREPGVIDVSTSEVTL